MRCLQRLLIHCTTQIYYKNTTKHLIKKTYRRETLKRIKMEKNAYKTYEFLPSNNAESDSNQYFVLQDDGTILSMNKELAYIAQVHHNTDDRNLNPTEDCSTVFDVPVQQYYVPLEYEADAEEMISLNDEFATATEGTHGYANYLIQPDDSSTSEQMDVEAFIDPQKIDFQQIQHLNVEAYNANKQTTDMTEITLTDEQYQILEQKGWLLMESNDKVFVLNTQGLHDITENERLVQRLRQELSQNPETEGDVGQLKIECVTSVLREDVVHVQPQPPGIDSVVEYIMTNAAPLQQQTDSQDVDKGDVEMDKPDEPDESELNKVRAVNSEASNTELLNKCESIKIKTKYIFSDISNKIFLGKTVNGKKLYAVKVNKIKSKCSVVNNIEKKIINDPFIDPTTLTKLIQDSYRNAPRPEVKSVEFAEAVVLQLLKLPHVTHSILANNLAITKVIVMNKDEKREVGQSTIVFGYVKSQDNNYVFTHAPNLLRELSNIDEDNTQATDTYPNNSKDTSTRGFIQLFHIHVSEWKYTDKPSESTIHLSQRKIPVEVLIDFKKKYPSPTYCCGSCGAVFVSEQALKDHQEDECIDIDDELTIDYTKCGEEEDKNKTPLAVVHKVNVKLFKCSFCGAKFTRYYNCKKHVNGHNIQVEKKIKPHQCRMCSASFLHYSTLSKHIVNEHIRMKLKNV